MILFTNALNVVTISKAGAAKHWGEARTNCPELVNNCDELVTVFAPVSPKLGPPTEQCNRKDDLSLVNENADHIECSTVIRFYGISHCIHSRLASHLREGLSSRQMQ